MYSLAPSTTEYGPLTPARRNWLSAWATAPGQLRTSSGRDPAGFGSLQIGEVTQTVEVNAAASIIEQESSERDQVIGQEDVQNLPLNGRDSASLALLAPGVRNSYALSKLEASFNVNGLRSQFNNFTLDGVDNNAYSTSNQGLSNQVVQLSPDALQEFSVITNTYSAEYGHVGGAVIQNQFGAGAGGPIKKDKSFIFADYEGFRLTQRALSFASVPRLDQRNGIF